MIDRCRTAIGGFSDFPAASLPRPRSDRRVACKTLIRNDFFVRGRAPKNFYPEFPCAAGNGRGRQKGGGNGHALGPGVASRREDALDGRTTMAALDDILEPGPAERLATGFVFTEGPSWHPDGFYYFVDIRRSLLFRLRPGQTPEIVRSETGEGNGTTFDLAGPPGDLRRRQPPCRPHRGRRQCRGADGPLPGQADQPPERCRLPVGRQHLVHRPRSAHPARREGTRPFRGLSHHARRDQTPRRRVRVPERPRLFAGRAHPLRRQHAPGAIHPRDRARCRRATWCGGASLPTCRRRRPTACPTA